MICIHCKQEHPKDYVYCPVTGAKIEWQLKACVNADCRNFGKHILSVESNFCPICGVKLGETDSENDDCVPDNYIYGHKYVDLGLPSKLKWATCNVGAEKPENCGSYFMWGETTPQDLSFITFIANKVELCSEISADPRCDAARFNWGGSWRLPSMEEFEELINECNWKWTIRGNSFGYKVTGGNGNHIFLPAAGYNIPTAQCFNDHSELFHLPKKNYRVMSYNHFNDNLGSYWTYSQKKGVSCMIYMLKFDAHSRYVCCRSPFCGQSIRPVSE